MPICKEDPLRKYNPDAFDFNDMKGEVSEAIEFDWKRDKVDDAKKRAIVDSKNYDDFKSRVAGCHLKPIHRAEFNAPPKFAFNRQVGPSAGLDWLSEKKVVSFSTAVSQEALSAIRGRGGGAPRNGREFERELRRCKTSEEKVVLVKSLDELSYARLFGRELDAEVLRQLLIAFDEVSGNSVAPPGTSQSFLCSLVRECPSSTAIAASFLIPLERNIIARLLARERRAGVMSQNEIVMVCAALGVHPSSVVAAAAQTGESTTVGDQVGESTTATCGGDVSEVSAAEGSGVRDTTLASGASSLASVSDAHTDVALGAGAIELMD